MGGCAAASCTACGGRRACVLARQAARGAAPAAWRGPPDRTGLPPRRVAESERQERRCVGPSFEFIPGWCARVGVYTRSRVPCVPLWTFKIFAIDENDVGGRDVSETTCDDHCAVAVRLKGRWCHGRGAHVDRNRPCSVRCRCCGGSVLPFPSPSVSPSQHLCAPLPTRRPVSGTSWVEGRAVAIVGTDTDGRAGRSPQAKQGRVPGRVPGPHTPYASCFFCRRCAHQHQPKRRLSVTSFLHAC